MAPDITAYEPHIKSVFADKLPCQIIDLKSPSESVLVQGFWHLIALGQSRWDAASLMQLFEHPAFQRRQQLSSDDVYGIREWIEKAAIRWGSDASHRNEFLQEGHCQKGMVDTSSIGTWEYGLTRLLFGLVMAADDAHEGSFIQMSFSQGDLLGKWSRLLSSLKDDLKPCHDRTEMTLADWSAFLVCLLKSYLAADPTDSSSSKEYEGLIEQIQGLRSSSTRFPQELFPFSSVKKHLEEAIQQRSLAYRENHFHAVRFCSMVPLRAIPARVIVLLGMNDGVFPKQDNFSSLNLLTKASGAHYCPSQSDYDRYLFLETLLSARDYFLITYQASEQDDAPSLLVTELLSYFDRFYRIQGKRVSEVCLYRHPFDSFDKSYFIKDSPLRSYSTAAFDAAQAYIHPDKQAPHAFVSDFPMRVSPPIEKEHSIDLKQLSAAARHPLKMYMNKTLNIYLDKEESVRLKTEEDLILSALERVMLTQKSLKLPLDQVLAKAEKEGNTPIRCL